MNKTSPFSAFTEKTRPALREELSRVVARAAEGGSRFLQEMITYQLGWTGENAGPKAEGKQIRPLLVLLATEAAGGEWQAALPAAAAVELIHNFSLIHDDIEDQGDLRRGRPTVWKNWGEAQAINTGDAMFALANLSLVNLEKTVSNEITLKASRLFHKTCLHLTQGQHLDIDFESHSAITLEEYWEMVGGKTAGLLAFSLEVGALCASVPAEIQNCYRDFGFNLGLAFQAQDDILGIWGNQEQIGKSNTSDLVTGKKTLPVVYGLEQEKEFFKRWSAGPITANEAAEMSGILEEEGGLAYTQKTASHLTDLALSALDNAQPQGEAGDALRELTGRLLKRQT
ncbi:MAG: polyprenyl synthetase family protein [Anaerolineales bacterium]|nr:polyprenyl synthetase family protein [Anaerolineales bacterium]